MSWSSCNGEINLISGCFQNPDYNERFFPPEFSIRPDMTKVEEVVLTKSLSAIDPVWRGLR